jgi:hypothetical protein
MGAHILYVIPFVVRPTPKPYVYEKPTLLPGISLCGIGSDLGRAVTRAVPFDTNELHDLIVVDKPEYTHAMINRLQREGVSKSQLDRLSDPLPGEWKQFYAYHPVEIEVTGQDFLKLVVIASILAGARSFVFHGPILIEHKSEAGSADLFETHSWSPEVRRWNRPRRPAKTSLDEADAASPNIGDLDLIEVSRYCRLLEPFFRAAYWHTGRFAIALGSLWASITSSDPAQSYLALMTVFEAVLSTDKNEITHQIAERTAYLLEKGEDQRYKTYRRMKQLYNTRSRVVHGDVENKVGAITTDRLRLDARITVVPKQDVSDAFEICMRVLGQVLLEPRLVSLLEDTRSKGALDEYYLRLGFR